MTLHGLCAPNTTVTDFAYPPGHPLRLANFPASKHSSLASDLDYYDDPQYESYSSDEINLRAIAIFDFTPENDNEVRLREGQEIWVLYRHGQGWLVAEDPETGENGLVPEEYVEIIVQLEPEDEPQRYVPQVLQNMPGETDQFEAGKSGVETAKTKKQVKSGEPRTEDDEWEDTDGEPELDEEDADEAEVDQNGLRELETGVEKLAVN